MWKISWNTQTLISDGVIWGEKDEIQQNTTTDFNFESLSFVKLSIQNRQDDMKLKNKYDSDQDFNVLEETLSDTPSTPNCRVEIK